MRMRVVILPDGAVQIFADEGSFEEAALRVQQVVAALGAVDAGPVEQHRHGPDEVHVHEQVHA